MSYAQHGWRHGRFGTDPSPSDALSSTPFALLRAGGTLSAGPTGDKFWWDLLPSDGTHFTNDPTRFANSTHAIAAGAGNVNSGTFGGLQILKPGVYKAHKTIQILSLYNDTTLRSIDIYQRFGGLSSTADMVFGDQNHMNQGHGFHFELWDLDAADAPSATILLASENGESSAYACIVSLYVEMKDAYPMPLF